MSDFTDDYGFQRLGPGMPLSTNGYKYGTTDRDNIARLLRRGAETHHHDGAVSGASGDEVGNRELDLVLTQTAGGIPAGTRVYYKFTLVDTDGFESLESGEFFIDTDPQVSTPAAPTLATASTGGVLLPGGYYYVLTAYVGTNTQETMGLNPVYLQVPTGTATNTITLTLPAASSGSDGFNVYRKQPGGVRYDYLTSIDMDVATPPTTFVDDGTIEEDCNRTTPAQNFTNTQNQVLVTLQGFGATPPAALEAGITWKLYRTYVINDYSDSFLTHVTSGVTHQDIGEATSGPIPSAGIEITNPPKVLLTDGAEVQGLLPADMIDGGVIFDRISEVDETQYNTDPGVQVHATPSDGGWVSFEVQAPNNESGTYGVLASEAHQAGGAWLDIYGQGPGNEDAEVYITANGRTGEAHGQVYVYANGPGSTPTAQSYLDALPDVASVKISQNGAGFYEQTLSAGQVTPIGAGSPAGGVLETFGLGGATPIAIEHHYDEDGARYNHTAAPQAWNGEPPVARPTVTGSRGGNAALASLLTALDALGLITDSSSA